MHSNTSCRNVIQSDLMFCYTNIYGVTNIKSHRNLFQCKIMLIMKEVKHSIRPPHASMLCFIDENGTVLETLMSVVVCRMNVMSGRFFMISNLFCS